MRSLAVAAVLAAGLALPAWAAQNADQGSSSTSSSTASGNQGHMSQAKIEHQLHADLSKAGFTDIHMMPQSFLVRAKNAQGMPVMMVINPDSITAVTAMKAPHQGGQNGMSGSQPMVGSQSGNQKAQ